MGEAFHPFLKALDTDAERVAAREQRAQSAVDLRELLMRNGTTELHRWRGTDEDYDEEAFADTMFPKIPLPLYDWVFLRDDLMAKGREEENKIPFLINSLARYAHALHYKIDDLTDQLANMRSVERSTARGWDVLLAKYPFLAECDDHVRQTPHVTPLMLSRTSAVTPLSCLRTRCVLAVSRACLVVHLVGLHHACFLS
jgi:hypothetical protein